MMRTINDGLGSDLRRKLVHAKGRISPRFAGGDLQEKENLSKRRAVEESVKMEGFEVNSGKEVAVHSETQQPMNGYSEFWIG